MCFAAWLVSLGTLGSLGVGLLFLAGSSHPMAAAPQAKLRWYPAPGRTTMAVTVDRDGDDDGGAGFCRAKTGISRCQTSN